MTFNYYNAFSRNIGLLTKEEQEKIKNTTVAIAGMGGVGGRITITCARLGIENFHISDMDTFDEVNFNRQMGAFTSSVGAEKVRFIENQIRDINPNANIKVFDKGINKDNVDEFLEGVDFVLDGMDFFNFDTRRLIFNKAHQKGIYVNTAGPIGFSTGVLTFDPKGMNFDDYFDVDDSTSDKMKYIKFFIGLCPAMLQSKYLKPHPENLNEKKGPSLVTAVNLCASFASAELLKLITGKGNLRCVPKYTQMDVRRMKLKKGWMPFGNKNPIQKIKIAIAEKLTNAEN